MERLLTRRNLFEFLAGGAVVAGAEATFVRKPVQVELTDDILTSLQERSKKISSRIFDAGLNDPTLSSLRLNNDATSEALLLLAFLDGGNESVEKIVDIINHRSLTVSMAPIVGGRFEVSIPLPSRSGIILLVFLAEGMLEEYLTFKQSNQEIMETPTTISDVDKAILSKLSYIVQRARDPENYDTLKMLGQAVIPAAVLAPTILTGNDVVCRGVLKPIMENPQFRRRDLLRVVTPFVSSVILLPFVIKDFLERNVETSLFKRQADFQSERLMNYPVFDHLRGNFLVLKDKELV